MSKSKILIVNGPNLNLLGKREPEIYGRKTLGEILAEVRAMFPGMQIEDFQSNSEGELITAIQRAGFDADMLGIVFNPGAYSHYSIALLDAVSAIPAPVVEVHISNIHSRDEFRHKLLTAQGALAVIAGCGPLGYSLAVEFLLSLRS